MPSMSSGDVNRGVLVPYMYAIRSRVIPSVNPHNFNGGSLERLLFSFNSCEGSPLRRIAGNLMLPIRARMIRRNIAEFFGASRDEMSTVTCDQVGCSVDRIDRGVQCRVISGDGSGWGECGESCKNTERVHVGDHSHGET